VKYGIIFREILGTEYIFSLHPAVGAGNGVLVWHFDLLQTGLAECVAAREDSGDLVDVVVFEITNVTLCFLHFG